MRKSVGRQFTERGYREGDFGALERIERDAGEARWNRQELSAFVECIVIDTRVITCGGEGDPIAFFVVEHGEETLYLCNIAVARSWRRRGVASFGLEVAEILARDLRYRTIALDVQEENLGAQLLYRRAGFRAVGICRRFYQDQDGYHMEKTLA